MCKVAILITTFERDELLYKCINSIITNLPSNFIILVGDQGTPSIEKGRWVLETKTKLNDQFHYREYPFNSGLSYTRNQLINLAKIKKCSHIVLGSESFIFNDSLFKIKNIIQQNLYGYDILGGELFGCCCGWEGKLNLIPNEGFELDFIDKTKKPDYDKEVKIWNIDICRNFFIAKIDCLKNSPWDENLKLCEHEFAFYEFKQKNYKIGWTNDFSATKFNIRPDKYSEFRRKNFNEGLQYLRRKYKFSGWVIYKNLNNSKI